MNHYQPTANWVMATYRMWSAASYGLASCVAGYAAFANYMAAGRKPRGGALLPAVTTGGQAIAANDNAIQKAALRQTDIAKTDAEAQKVDARPPDSHGKSGRKRAKPR